MTAIKLERSGESRNGTDKNGAAKFDAARPPPQRLGDVDQAAASAVEGEIREFVRRDVTFARGNRNGVEPNNEPVADNLNALIRRVSGASMEEIDRVILELQGVRDMLRGEGERVSREIAGYASLSHAAMTAMTVIAESLKQWKSAPAAPRSRAN
jgi:hypothetical protein